MQRRRIILCVTNDLSADQRMHRIAGALQAAGYEACLVGRQLPASLPLSARSYRCVRLRCRFHKGKLFYAEYNLRLFFWLMRQPKAALNACDLDTLPAAWLASRLRRQPLIYDSHEYFTEVPELIHRPFTRRIWVAAERFLFPRVDAAYTVNASIAGIYARRYKRPVQVVRNLPLRRAAPQAPREPVLLYQGSLNMGRGIELMVDAMTFLPEYTLRIIGRGDIEAELRARAAASSAAARIEFVGFVPFEALHEHTGAALLGFSLEADLGDNYRYASPNKVYDYIQARTPVLVSDLPEMAALVKEQGVGAVLPDDKRSPEALAAFVRQLLKNSEGYAQMVAACERAATLLNWEQEQQQLLSIWKHVLDKKAPPQS